MIEPLRISATSAAMLKDTYSQQAVSELMRLNGQGVTKVFLDRLFRRKYLALVPGLTNKMRCVEIEIPERFSQHIVIATVGGNVEYL